MFSFPDSVSFCDKYEKTVRKSTAILLKHFQVQKCVYLLHCYMNCFKCEVETGHAVPDDTFASLSLQV